MIALMVFGCAVYLFATETIPAERSRGEILVFRRSQERASHKVSDEEARVDDRLSAGTLSEETTLHTGQVNLYQQTSVFQWSDVAYDINIKKKTRRLLANVDGWIKPGTLTALMVRVSLVFRYP